MQLTLLKPFYYSAKNRFFPPGSKPWKGIGIAAFCLAVCIVLYLVSLHVIRYFHGQNELGIILSVKIFEMAWITMFALQVFSCMVSAVAAIFLSMDNEIVYAAPVTPSRLYSMRYWTTAVYTSWMMILFSMPVYIAFGQVFNAGILYWPLMSLSVISVALTAVGIGIVVTVALVNLFPAKRTKDIVFYLSLCFAVFIYFMFRLLRPEELANPEQFGTFVEYLSTISSPTGPYVPGAWAANLLSLYLLDQEIDLLLLGLLVTTPFTVFFLGEWVMHCWFFSGYSKSQESFGGHHRFKNTKMKRISPFGWVARKEAKAFLRDSAEWSQLFMIAALVVIYLYNFKVLPMDRSFWREEYLANLISFLNIGLTGFVIISLSARFVFPSIGAEGGSFYLIRSSPLSIKKYLFYKYVFYCTPFLFLSTLLITVSDYLLKIQGPILWISLVVSVLITLTSVAMALGFGALYADFKAESRAAALGGVGAILYLLTCMTYEGVVLLFGSWPAYKLTKRWLREEAVNTVEIAMVVGWLFFAALLSICLAGFILNKGIKKLEQDG